jgi:hypothetical protein
MASKRTFPMKLVGDVNWVGAPAGQIGGQVKRAIWRSANNIVLHCKSSGYEYNADLNSTDSVNFEGHFQDMTRTYTVRATAKLYTNDYGIVLVGDWTEDNLQYKWWAELSFDQQFADENE